MTRRKHKKSVTLGDGLVQRSWDKVFSTSKRATKATTNESYGHCWQTYGRVLYTLEGYLGNRSLDCALVTNQQLHLCVDGPLGEAAICCNQSESEGQKNIENRSTKKPKRAKSMKHKLRKRQNMIFNEKIYFTYISPLRQKTLWWAGEAEPFCPARLSRSCLPP